MRIAQLDNSKSPAVVLAVWDYGSDEPPAALRQPPDYVEVTDVSPPVEGGFTFDGTNWVPGAPQIAEQNQAALETRMQQALQANVNYLALAPPTQAQLIAQVNALTRQCSALIRVWLGQLGSTSGT